MLKVISIYKCKDGRIRAYCRDEYNNPKVISYPRILMEENLGRPLKPYEDAHLYMVGRSRLEVILMLNVG